MENEIFKHDVIESFQDGEVTAEQIVVEEEEKTWGDWLRV